MWPRSNERTRKHFAFIRLEIKERALEDIPQPWVKFNLTGEPPRMKEVEAYCRRHYTGQYFMEFSAPYFFEVMGGGANKGTGARIACAHCGIAPEHLYTMGDNFNDKELLAAAHMSFAPENAGARDPPGGRPDLAGLRPWRAGRGSGDTGRHIPLGRTSCLLQANGAQACRPLRKVHSLFVCAGLAPMV